MDEPWDPPTIAEIAGRLDATSVDWWVAGGHAIDAYLGWTTRSHDDLDIELLRADRAALADAFAGWDLVTVTEGARAPWDPGAALPDEVFAVWARPGPDRPWAVEIMLAAGDADTWRFRRDPRIEMPLARLIRRTLDGIPYCIPEVQLLYKAKRARPKDDIDLARCLHRMNRDRTRWLHDALAVVDASHPWIPVLSYAT